MTDMEEVLKDLAAERPIFHSEADFQHALAWRIHKVLPEAKVRLEFKPFRASWSPRTCRKNLEHIFEYLAIQREEVRINW